MVWEWNRQRELLAREGSEGRGEVWEYVRISLQELGIMQVDPFFSPSSGLLCILSLSGIWRQASKYLIDFAVWRGIALIPWYRVSLVLVRWLSLRWCASVGCRWLVDDDVEPSSRPHKKQLLVPEANLRI